MVSKKSMRKTCPVCPTDKVAGLLDGMAKTGFQGRKLGESVNVWKRILADPKCTIFFGLSGAMIPAGMQRCLVDMVKHHYVDVIVSTGANIFHDICEHTGVCHYLGHHNVDDARLYKEGIDRIYDVFAFEEEFRRVDWGIAQYAETIAPFRGSSREFISLFGEYLIKNYPNRESITSTCAKKRSRSSFPRFVIHRLVSVS